MCKTLKCAGLKSTRGRMWLLNILQEADRPLSAEELHRRQPNRGSSLSTIYRNLAALSSRGVFIKTVGQDGVAAYQLNTNTHYHCIVCTVCGGRRELTDCPVGEFSQQIEASTGFSVTSHSLEFMGLCPHCRSKEEG